jgi:hypothetical protein
VEDEMKRYLLFVLCGFMLLRVEASELYFTGFEIGEGWARGSLGVNPQDQTPGGSWNNISVAQVQNFNPRTGDDSVYFNSTNVGNHTATFTPDSPYAETDVLTISYYVYLPAYPTEEGDVAFANDNNHRLDIQTDATLLRVQFDNFGTEGNPERHRSWITSGLGTGGQNGLMEQVWAAGEWTRVEFTLNFTNNTYAYYVTSPTRGFSAIENQAIGHDISELQSVAMIHRDVGAAFDLTMYVDDFTILEGGVDIPSPPSITVQPQAVVAQAGEQVAFDVEASGEGPLVYQWRENGTPVSTSSNALFQLGAVVPAQDGHAYDVIVSSPYGAVTSTVATLTVTLPSDALYYTGFELGEGWTAGSLGVNPDDQPPGGAWGNISVAQVQPFNPHTGDHSVYFNSTNVGNHTATFTPDELYAGYRSITLSYYVYMPAHPAADGNSQISNDNNHRLQLATDATMLTVQWDNFDSVGGPGRQRIWMQGGLGSGGEQGVSNQAWEPGEWTYFALTLDFQSNTYSYVVRSPTQGEKVVANQVIGHDISSLSGASFIHRDVGTPLDLTMYLDDVLFIGTTTEHRPTLTATRGAAANEILLEWPADPGDVFRVEESGSLVFPDWQLLQEVTATNSTAHWLFTIPAENDMGFIRLNQNE